MCDDLLNVIYMKLSFYIDASVPKQFCAKYSSTLVLLIYFIFLMERYFYIFIFRALSLEGRRSKSAFENGLWQVYSSITQLPTSVSVGKEAASWYRFVKARVLFCVLCVRDGVDTSVSTSFRVAVHRSKGLLLI